MPTPRNIAILDFESAGIDFRPDYPPIPCSFSYRTPKQKTTFVSWGHPKNNNSTFPKAKKILLELYHNYSIVCHHLKFDAELLQQFFNLPYKNNWHCTQVLAFLNNPYAKTLALKSLTDDFFNMPPVEQDNLMLWILGNVKGTNTNKKSFMYWARYICLAPGGVVEPYANSDVDRTYKLFRYLWPRVITKYKMLIPYERELKLIPHLWAMEKKGVRTKQRQLKKGISVAENNQSVLAKKIRKRIGVGKNFNLDKKEQFADALEAANKVDSFIKTKGPITGKLSRSVSRENLALVLEDDYLKHMLEVRSKIKTFLQTFLKPWYELSKKNNGMMHTQFSATRASSFGRNETGAKSGRITSSNPNFFNVPKTVEVPDGLPKISQNLYSLIPHMRHYIHPDPGKLLIARDYVGQELRILANYEYDDLYAAYKKNIFLSVHEIARVKINRMLGLNLTKRPIKTIGFGIIYGMGIPMLAKKMELPIREAEEVRRAYLEIFPGISPLIKNLKALEKNEDYLTTWGGRVYYTEPPAVVQGRLRNFGYKMLNYLIQSSAADIIKEAYLRASNRGLDVRIVLYDELINNAHIKTYREEMHELMECMESVELDIYLLSEGKYGKQSWGEMKKYSGDKRRGV